MALCGFCGGNLDTICDCIESQARAWPFNQFPRDYGTGFKQAKPGPNSNTFVQETMTNCGLDSELPPEAVGRDWFWPTDDKKKRETFDRWKEQGDWEEVGGKWRRG